MDKKNTNRRPIASRSTGWAQYSARMLARTSVSPNQISVFSLFFAGGGAAVLLLIPGVAGLVLCALGIQLRLLCNLLDGMVAVEYGKGSPLGAMYNEFPDRLADSILIVALGYAIEQPWLGWLGALLALGTAYIRVFGGALGQEQDFRGPMSKSHRMAAMTAGCLLAAIELPWRGTEHALLLAAVVIVIGAALTCVNRARFVARRRLEQG